MNCLHIYIGGQSAMALGEGASELMVLTGRGFRALKLPNLDRTSSFAAIAYSTDRHFQDIQVSPVPWA